MAQIPQNTFGQVVSSPAQTADVPRMDVSSGLNQFADQAGSIASGYLQQQTNAKTALALATATNSAHDAHDQVAQGLQDGSIAPGDAQAELQKRIDASTEAQTQGLPAAAVDTIRTQMVGTAGALQRSMAGAVFKYNQSETAATIDATGQQLQQDAQRRGPAAAADSYDAIMDFTGASAGFTPAQMQAKKIAFRQGTTHGWYDDSSAAMFAAGDQTGIASMLQTVASGNLPEGQELTQDQRAHLTTKLVGYNTNLLAQQARAQAQADSEQVARENAAADAFNGAQKIILNGQFLDQPTMDNLAAATAGTKQEQPARELLAAQPHIVAFASQPAAVRASMLEHYASEAANPGVGTSPDNQKQVSALQSIDAKANDLAKDDPWKAAQTYGVIVNAPAMNMSDPSNALPLLDQRMQQIGKVEAWVGHKVSPLQPAEAEQLGHTLHGMPPDQAASMLSMVGSMVGDPDRIGAVAKQLGKASGDDGAMTDNLGLAMSYAGDRTTDGKLTGELILRGAAAIKNRTTMVDNTQQSGWKANIFNQIDGAFSSQSASDAAMKAAFLIAGANGGDVDAAVKAATGGIIQHGSAGGKIPLPVNMDETTFDKRLSSITPAMLAPQSGDGNAYVGDTPMPLQKFIDSLPDATLVHAGQGSYVVKAGASFVTNRAGQRIVLRITQ